MRSTSFSWGLSDGFSRGDFNTGVVHGELKLFALLVELGHRGLNAGNETEGVKLGCHGLRIH